MRATPGSPFRVAIGFVVLCLASPSTGVSQDFCQRALRERPFPNLRNSTKPAESLPWKSPYWLFTWHLAFAHQAWLDSVSRGLIKPSGSYSYQEWFLDSTDIPSNIRTQAPKDSATRWSAAFELANLFEAGNVGATEGMAFAAASLYRAWRLPPEPAAALLADPPVATMARTRAIRALEPYWATQTFRLGAAAALCILAANAEGRASLRHTDTLSKFDAFDMEQHELLSSIVFALGTVAERGGPSADSVFALLPPKNPLTMWVRGSSQR